MLFVFTDGHRLRKKNPEAQSGGNFFLQGHKGQERSFLGVCLTWTNLVSNKQANEEEHINDFCFLICQKIHALGTINNYEGQGHCEGHNPKMLQIVSCLVSNWRCWHGERGNVTYNVK